MNEKELVGKTKSPKRQTLLIAGYKSIPNIMKDEDDRASQLEENEPAEVTKSPRRQPRVIQKGKSDSSTPDSEMDERDDTEAQDDKVNQVKREESVEKTESLRKPTSMTTKYTPDSYSGNTENGNMEAEEEEPAVKTESLREHEQKRESDSKVSDPDNIERGDKEDHDDKANQVKDKEPAVETVPPRRQAPLIAECEPESDVPNFIKDVNDKASEITESPRRRSLLISEGKTDLNTPDSDEGIDIETQDDKTNQVKEKESVEATESPRKLLTIEMTGIMIKRLRMIRPVRWKKRNQYLRETKHF